MAFKTGTLLTDRRVRCSAYNACIIKCTVVVAVVIYMSQFSVVAIKQTTFISLAFYTSQPERTFAGPKGATTWGGNSLWVTKLSAYHVTYVDIEAVITDCAPCSIVFDFYSSSIPTGTSVQPQADVQG